MLNIFFTTFIKLVKFICFMFTFTFISLSVYAKDKCLRVMSFESNKDLKSFTKNLQNEIVNRLLQKGAKIETDDTKVASINYSIENQVLGSNNSKLQLKECEQILTGQIQENLSKEQYQIIIKVFDSKTAALKSIAQTPFFNKNNTDFFIEEVSRKVLNPSYKIESSFSSITNSNRDREENKANLKPKKGIISRQNSLLKKVFLNKKAC